MTVDSHAENPRNNNGFWSHLVNTRMLVCIFTGFASGMPLYILYQLVPAWLRSEQVDLKVIGLFVLIQFPYTWKFLWAPIMDRFVPPFLGRRRGWMLVTQVALIALIAAFSFFDPGTELIEIAIVATLVAFFSASQDIVLDAYRRELLPDSELGVGNSYFTNAYRLSSLIPGSLALVLSDFLPWSSVHLIVAGFMFVAVITTLLIPEPDTHVAPPRNFYEAVIEPFVEFFTRSGWRSALWVLGFLFLYKLGDNLATALSTPFYIDLGFSRTEIGTVAKFAALWSTITGSIIAGVVMIKLGINRALWIFGFVQWFSILGFAWLARAGADPVVLFAAVSFEYLGVGLGSVALIAFMARMANKRFTATQFALLSSLASLPRVLANATTGYLVEGVDTDSADWVKSLFDFLFLPRTGLGWENFFYLCFALAIPGLLMLAKVAPWRNSEL